MRVTPPPPAVPLWRVVNSRMRFSLPISSALSSPAYFEILRLGPHRGELEHAVPLADPGAALDDRVRPDGGPGADLDLGANHRVGADLDGGVKPRPGCDDGRGVDAHRSLSTTVARNSPSATTSPSTLATPRFFTTAPLSRSTSTSRSSRSPGTVGFLNFAPSMAMR